MKKKLTSPTTEILQFAKKKLKQEADALSKNIESLDRDFVKAAELLANCSGKVITCGVGKAGIIAQKMASTFTSLGKHASFLHPTEAIHGDMGMIKKKDLLVLFSNSGSAGELVTLLSFMKKSSVYQKIKIILITSKGDSTLAKEATVSVVYLGSKEGVKELDILNCVPTTSTTLMLAITDVLILTAEKIANHTLTKKEFSLYHPAGNIGKQVISVDKVMLSKTKTVVVTGEALLKDVLIKMSGKKLGGAVIVEKKKVIGFFSDGDLRRYINKSTSLMTAIKELMTQKPIVIHCQQTVSQAVLIFHKYKINDIPVVDDNDYYVGLLSLKDIV